MQHKDRLACIFAIARFTYLEAVRARLLGFVLVSLAGAYGLAELAAAISITETAPVRALVFAGSLRLWAVFVMALFVTSAMLRELHDKGLEQVLALALGRGDYYIGKFSGFCGAALSLAVVVGLATCVYAPPAQAALWTISLAAELIIITALGLVCLFTFSQVTVALAAVVAFYALSRMMGAIVLMSSGSLIEPGSPFMRFTIMMVRFIAALLPDLYRFTPGEWLAYHTGEPGLLAPIIIQSIIYTLILGGAGLFDLYRKNF